jgi:ribonuclease HI
MIRLARLEAWTDGSGTTADRHAGIGVVLVVEGVVVCEASEPIGLGTNNDAEVRAIKRALFLAWAHAGRTRGLDLVVWSDSMFALDAVRPGCAWNIRRPALRALCEAVRAECARWPALQLAHVEGHTGVVHNERADVLAGRARKAGIARAAAALPLRSVGT